MKQTDRVNAVTSSDILITVAICTYRRYSKLSEALDGLTVQEYSGFSWNVLVVENDTIGSAEMTEIINEYSNKLPMKWVLQTTIGLSYARNTAAQETDSTYIAYLDDDAIPSTGWLQAIADCCLKHSPDICGGPALPLYRSAKPFWFRDEYAISYHYGSYEIHLPRKKYLGGMNFIVNRMLVINLDGFRTDLGMKGNTNAYGEETCLMIDAWNSNDNLIVIYKPECIVYHEVKPEIMSVRGRTRLAVASAKSTAIMVSNISWCFTLENFLRSIFRIVIHLPVLAIEMLLTPYRGYSRNWRVMYIKKTVYLLHSFTKSIYQIGILMGIIRFRHL